MSDIDLAQVKKIHFVGIGGIGMSALARMMLHAGKQVSGSDISPSELIDSLKSEGVSIEIGQGIETVPTDVDLVVRTIAVDEYDPYLVSELKERDTLSFTYPEMLGITSKGKYTIAVSGTHGKTTTTAMIATILLSAQKDPTVVVGSLLGSEKSNFIHGKSNLFVVEACEYKRSFLHLHPNILVITNIEEDHLDYYKDLRDIQEAFHELAVSVPEDGFIICNTSDPSLTPVLEGVNAKVIDYTNEAEVKDLLVPGAHNRSNAQASIAAAKAIDVSEEEAVSFVKGFKGTWRRGEYRGVSATGAEIYDDYAHHPTEIKATLQGFREMFPDKKMMVIFQPHLFSRTKLLFDDFTDSFSDADEVLFLPIYAAREAIDKSISSDMLSEKIQEKGLKSAFFDTFEDVAKYITSSSDENTVVITMGAGDIYTLIPMLCE